MVTPGYFGQPALTAEAFDEDGFYRTGDAVALADAGDLNAGLVFRGRIAEDFKLQTGTFVRVGALRTALLHEQIAEQSRRANTATRYSAVKGHLGALQARLNTMEKRAAEAATRAAATGNANVSGIAVNTAGMVQPPAGAPEAVRQVIAAGNAIATLPYIYGGGHASFHADGYDCSGSVSYALAAAGLVSSPMVSGGFEDWGEAGPGRWITIYANAGHVWMDVAGWRFDTVALAESGTRWARGGGEFSDMVVRHPAGL